MPILDENPPRGKGGDWGGSQTFVYPKKSQRVPKGG